jgi:AbrB family looped-hinge helix DNA binding protein
MERSGILHGTAQLLCGYEHRNVMTLFLLTYIIKVVINTSTIDPNGGAMDRAVVTSKGQIVIPSKLRRKFGIEKGTRVYVYERDGEIAIKPITDDYIRNMAGMAGTKGKLLKALMYGKAKERKL